MNRTAFGLSVLAITLSGSFAAAQSPAIGQPPPVGQLWGYSPLVPTIDPFPSRTSGYAQSMFLRGIGGKRVYPSLAMPAQPPKVVVERCPTCMTASSGMSVGPVQPALPARAWYRFNQ